MLRQKHSGLDQRVQTCHEDKWWLAADAILLLRAIIPTTVSEQILEEADLEKALAELERLHYTRQRAHSYVEAISNITQGRYFLIKEYQEALSLAITRASIAKGWNKSQQIDRQEEAFLSGLGRCTAIEMAKLNLTTVADTTSLHM